MDMTKILFSKIQIAGREIKLKPLYLGENASFTDYSNQKTEIFLVKCTDSGGEIWISKSGYSIEEEDIREVNSFDLELETKFNDEYRRNIKTRFGEGILIMKYSDVNNN